MPPNLEIYKVAVVRREISPNKVIQTAINWAEFLSCVKTVISTMNYVEVRTILLVSLLGSFGNANTRSGKTAN